MSRPVLSASRRRLRAWTCPSFSRSLRLCAALAALALAAFAFAPQSSAQESGPTEFQVEAAYLYHFGDFVTWPSNASAAHPKQFPICILGHDPFGSTLDNMVKGSAIAGAPILARRVTSAKDATSCRIVFVSSSEARHLEGDLADLRGSPILTVSDIPDFDVRGGMVQFVLIDRRVRFEVNLSPAQKAGLRLSSQLLKVAVSVRSDRNPRE
jgi:YfiR/HmsC-like